MHVTLFLLALWIFHSSLPSFSPEPQFSLTCSCANPGLCQCGQGNSEWKCNPEAHCHCWQWQTQKYLEINTNFFKNTDEKCMRSIQKNVDMQGIKLNVYSDACSFGSDPMWMLSHLSSYVMSHNVMKKDDVHAMLKTGFSSFIQLYLLP